LDQRICQLTLLIKESHSSLEKRMTEGFKTMTNIFQSQTIFMSDWASLFSNALCTVLPPTEIPAFKAKVDTLATSQLTTFKKHMSTMAKLTSNTTSTTTFSPSPSSPIRSSESSITQSQPTPNPNPTKRTRRDSEIDLNRNKLRARSTSSTSIRSSLNEISNNQHSTTHQTIHQVNSYYNNNKLNDNHTDKSITPSDKRITMDESRPSTIDGNDF
jgi:hypothetical protein